MRLSSNLRSQNKPSQIWLRIGHAPEKSSIGLLNPRLLQVAVTFATSNPTTRVGPKKNKIMNIRLTLTGTLLTTLLVVFPAAAAEPPQLRGIREAVLDTLRETPKSVFPAEGIPLRASAPAAAAAETWHYRTGVHLGLGAFKKGDRVELFRGAHKIPVQTEVLAVWGPADSEFGESVKWLGVDFVDAARGASRQSTG